MITRILSRKSGKLTLLELQKLCGFLNFLCRAIVPGRAFTRRLYALLTGKVGSAMKPHHHLKLKQETRMDLELWLQFLKHQSAFARPFTDFRKCWSAVELGFYTDASSTVGLGAICGSSWMWQTWPIEFTRACQPSIEYLELFALTAAVLAWVEQFANKRIWVYCDNQSVLSMVQNASSSCRNCMVLIRILTLHCLIHNVKLCGKYVSTKENIFADSLSRGKLNLFWSFAKQTGKVFNPSPTPVPYNLWPPGKIWSF